jgi:WD40 repeat protein
MRCIAVLILLTQVTAANITAAQPDRPPRLDGNGDPLPEGAVARLGTIRFQPGCSVSAAALSPDGTTVAAVGFGGKDGIVELLDTKTGKSIRQFHLRVDDARQIQFTPDGKGVLLNGYSGVRLIDGVTGKVTRTLEIDNAQDSSLAVSADGKQLAVQPLQFVENAPVSVRDLKTGKEVVSLPGRGAACKGLAFAPDGKRLLLWSVLPTAQGRGMIIDYNARTALACIDVATRKIVGETTTAAARFAALCPDGETVAIEAANQKSVRVRHLPTGAERCAIPVKSSRFAFAPDGKALFTVDESGRATLWDASKGTRIRTLEGAVANKDFTILGLSKDGQTVAVLDGGWDSAAAVVVWNAATGKRLARPAGHEGTVTCLAYGPGGKRLVSGSIDRTVRLWDPGTGKQLRLLTIHKEAVTAVAISPDGKLVASSSRAGPTRVCNLADGKSVAEFAGPAPGLPEKGTVLTFSADSKLLFAGGGAPEVLAWEVASKKEVVRLKTGNDGAVMALGDGGALALTANGEIRDESTPERLQVWVPAKKQAAASLILRGGDIGSVRCDAAIFSPDGRLIASSQVSEYQGIRPSYGDARLRLWERRSGEPIRTLGPIITRILAFSPNGRLLASGEAGRSGHLRVGYGSGVVVWDILTGDRVGSLPVTPQCIAFSPDGLHLATGDRDHCVLIWKAPVSPPRKKAKPPTAAERQAWWTALGRDASTAYKAVGQMIDSPKNAIALLKERVRPIRASGPDTVARLITQLDSDRFDEREKAQQALEQMGEGTAHHLEKALHAKVDVELHRRLQRLLKKCNETSIAAVQHHRAVAALEWIATPAARDLLRTLADGAPGARLTREARAALQRLPP